MAYFEYDYVNPDYDELSAQPPQQGDAEAITIFPYNTSDVISSKIVNFNIDLFDAQAQKIVNFNIDVNALVGKIWTFNNDVITDGYYIHKKYEIGLAVLNPLFIYKSLEAIYDVGDVPEDSSVFITRLNQDD